MSLMFHFFNYTFYFEIIVDSHAIESHKETACICFPVSHKVVSYKIIVTTRILTLVQFTHLIQIFAVLFVFVYMWGGVLQCYETLSCVSSCICCHSRYRTVPPSQTPFVLLLYSHICLQPLPCTPRQLLICSPFL